MHYELRCLRCGRVWRDVTPKRVTGLYLEHVCVSQPKRWLKEPVEFLDYESI